MPVAAPDPPVRILRVIARMNIGGPAYHVSLLAARLDRARYATVLATGAIGPGEGSLDELADGDEIDRRVIGGLMPPVRPVNDLQALANLIVLMRRWRPEIVHTHTAKAGLLGRVAARVAFRRPPVLVHTYHGHVLTGYFGPVRSGIYRRLERALAPGTDRLVGVSRATVDELVALGVAERERFSVVPIGLDLDAFLDVGPPTAARRGALGGADGELVVTFVGRLVAIKRVDVLIDAVAIARTRGAPLHLAIVGDGDRRAELETHARARGLDGHVTFHGFRRELAAIAGGTDIAALSSDNEGTPVALIEAAAAGRPAVATAVGGVTDIVTPATGITVAPGDPEAFAAALIAEADDPALRARFGAAARDHVRAAYASDRLVADIERLYAELLEHRAAAAR